MAGWDGRGCSEEAGSECPSDLLDRFTHKSAADAESAPRFMKSPPSSHLSSPASRDASDFRFQCSLEGSMCGAGGRGFQDANGDW